MRSRLNWPPSGFGVTANRLPLSPIGSIGPLSTTISTPLGSMSASPSANLLQFPQPEPPSPAIPPNVPPLGQIGRQNSIGHNNPRTFTFVPLRQPGSAGFPTARSKSKRPNMGMSRRQRKDFSALENLMISSRFPRTLSGSHEKPRNRARQRRKPVTQTDFASLVK
ncbi:hypothetical protein DdX_06172 [Ditylenchus destructor]|uniref:Uncharacterized protein n=1 Tax=Ditylenchus destructor TaxID=166010 RepID=A0AAD4R9J5_9BILA|nr:hypothetical protein DdX_06172 [Ditylenchus destructor]